VTGVQTCALPISLPTPATDTAICNSTSLSDAVNWPQPQLIYRNVGQAGCSRSARPGASLPNPKSEDRNPKEIRIPKPEVPLAQDSCSPPTQARVRICGFGLPSDFGLRFAFRFRTAQTSRPDKLRSSRPRHAARTHGRGRLRYLLRREFLHLGRNPGAHVQFKH
jgi:hypothetical protein